MIIRELTPRQAEALEAAFQYSRVWNAPAFRNIGVRSNAGGALRRMIEALQFGNSRVGPPLLDRDTHITAAGMRALWNHAEKRRPRPEALIEAIRVSLPSKQAEEEKAEALAYATRARMREIAAQRLGKVQAETRAKAKAILMEYNMQWPDLSDQTLDQFIERMAAL